MNYAWSELMIRELVRLGVDTFYVCPGSRSSPLAISAAEFGKLMVVHFDERGAAFAALGHARATGRPSVIITTSGSAVANLWPAVCEASNDGVPLILLTADRPPELRDTGSNQTMDQVKYFGSYARWYVDMPCPDTKISPAFVLSTVDYAFHRAMSPLAGPVHLNQMFREPLAPVAEQDSADAWLKQVGKWWKSRSPWTQYTDTRLSPGINEIQRIKLKLAKARRGVIIAGAVSGTDDSRAISKFAEKLGWPLIPDIRSGLRLKPGADVIIQMADQILLSDKFRRAVAPDVIVHLGGRITSKRIQQFISQSSADYVLIHDQSTRMDPDHRVTCRITATLPAILNRLATDKRGASSWLRKWVIVNNAVQLKWRSIAEKATELSEPGVAHIVARSIPAGHRLALASSMPIRDMDMYGLSEADAGIVASNRGVSGIDGNIASAIGFACGAKSPVTLIIGDLAFLHDMNSLAMLKSSPYPVTIIVVNNNGGGIFSFLPIASAPRHYETCFGTPHGMEFAEVAAMHDVNYAHISTGKEFKSLYREFADSGRHGIIEVRTDRADNVKLHRTVQAQLKKTADDAC